jgi:HEAT repeat protein
MLQTQEKIRVIAKKLALASNKVKIKPLLVNKTISEFERLKAISELKYLRENAAREVGKQAILALGRMLPEFIENKAVEELKYLGTSPSREVRKQAISALVNLKALKELKSLVEFATPSYLRPTEEKKFRPKKELTYFGEYSLSEIMNQALSPLERMLPKFIENKAVSELEYLSTHATNKVAFQARLELERIKSAQGIQDEDKTAEQLVQEIKEMLSALN